MSIPAPFTSTATRDGSRIVVARHDDVDGAALITILTDDLGLLSLSPRPAETLGRLLLRAVADTTEVTVVITNSYPQLGRHFARTETAIVAAPADGADLESWAMAHLIPLTGEGEAYADTYGIYEVRVTAAPLPFEHLTGLTVHAEG